MDERCPVLERLGRVADGLKDVVLDLDQRCSLARGVSARGRDRRQRVTHVAGRLALRDEERPIPCQQSLDPLAGDVARGDDRQDAGVGRRPRGIDPEHDGARMVGEADGPVKHARDAHVGHELVLPERHAGAAIAPGPLPHPVARRGHRRADPGLGAGPTRHGDRIDGLDDLGVAGAPAEVAGQAARDLIAARFGHPCEQRLGLHDDAGRAEPALRSPTRGEGLRPGGPRRVRQSLEREHGPALDPAGRLRAGHHGTTIDDDRAGTARAFGRTAVLERAQATLAAQQVKQAGVRWRSDIGGAPVEDEPHREPPLCAIRRTAGQAVWPYRSLPLRSEFRRSRRS